MNSITQAALAKRLGVGRSAITNAATAGKLRRLPDGSIDLDAAETREYTARFTLHRGKAPKARPEALTPEAMEAQRHRVQSQYGRLYAKFTERRAKYTPAPPFYAAARRMLEQLRAALAALPATVEYGATRTELELERAFIIAMKSGQHGIRLVMDPSDGEPDPARLPPAIPESADLTASKAYLDELGALRHEMEHAIEAKEALTIEDCKRRLSAIDQGTFAACRSAPRRMAGIVAALFKSAGPEAARAALTAHVAEIVQKIAAMEAAIQ